MTILRVLPFESEKVVGELEDFFKETLWINVSIPHNSRQLLTLILKFEKSEHVTVLWSISGQTVLLITPH